MRQVTRPIIRRIARWRRRCGAGLGFPAGRWNPITKCASHHEDQRNQGENDQGLRHTHVGRRGELHHEVGCERRTNHGPTAEAHDGQTRSHAPAVGEPFDQGRDRRDVAETQADAANHARANQHHPELVKVHAKG